MTYMVTADIVYSRYLFSTEMQAQPLLADINSNADSFDMVS